MPFPLAHPAAVLPLRRFCPRWLNFPALVIGSMIPDAGYFFGRLHGGTFSHGLPGSVVFCLPAGIVLVALFYRFRAPLVRMLPAPYQRALLPLCQQPPCSLWAIVISLLIGIWTHLVWDSFTHTNGWCVQHLPVLDRRLVLVAGRQARVCHLLWYGCSFAGIVWLFWVFEKWKRGCLSGTAGASSKAVIRDAAIGAILLVPIELVHHLADLGTLGLLLLAVACGLLVIGIFVKLGSVRKDVPADPPAAAGPEMD
jgi:hypothetical protein